MGRAPCCDKANVKRGPWSPEEDAKLKLYVEKFGNGGNWIALPQKIGLKRCGKSCRLRWLNYLRPIIKHGEFSEEEENIICTLYLRIGSRWSYMAAQLPGRTDNDIKNYWNTRLKKKLIQKQSKQRRDQTPRTSASYHKHDVKWNCENRIPTGAVKFCSHQHQPPMTMLPSLVPPEEYYLQNTVSNFHNQSIINDANAEISTSLPSGCGFDSGFIATDFSCDNFPAEFQEEMEFKNLYRWDGLGGFSFSGADMGISGSASQENATTFEDINSLLCCRPTFSCYEFCQNIAIQPADCTLEEPRTMECSSPLFV